MTNTSRKILRITGIVIVCLIAIGIIAAVWLHFNYKHIIQEKLPTLGAKATDTLYKVKAGDVNINLIDRKVVITDFDLDPNAAHISRLRADFRLPPILLKIHIDTIRLSDIDWSAVLSTHEIRCGNMEIIHPVVRITKLSGKGKEKEKDNKQPDIEAIIAQTVSIINPDIVYKNDTTSEASYFAANRGKIVLDDWQYDLRKPNDSSRLFYASNTNILLDTFFLKKAGQNYKTGAGPIRYDQATKSLELNQISIVPAISRAEFYKKIGYQKEIYTVYFPQVALKGLDWRALLQQGKLIASSGKMSNADIDIYMDRVPPLNTRNKNGKFPQQLLMKLALPINIPEISINNGRFAYTERNKKTMQEGTISMSDIGGAVSNVTNIPALLRRNNVLKVLLHGSFKGSDIQALFQFKTNSKQGAFSLKGSMGRMDGTRLNDITKPMALTEIESLQIQGVDFNLAGDELGAKGTLKLRYSDLKAKLLKPSDDGLSDKDVMSFLTNNLLIHHSNPEHGKSVRSASPQFDRDATKSFFNLVWKTIFTGALQTVSRDIVHLDKMVNKRAARQEEERRKKEGH